VHHTTPQHSTGHHHQSDQRRRTAGSGQWQCAARRGAAHSAQRTAHTIEDGAENVEREDVEASEAPHRQKHDVQSQRHFSVLRVLHTARRPDRVSRGAGQRRRRRRRSANATQRNATQGKAEGVPPLTTDILMAYPTTSAMSCTNRTREPIFTAHHHTHGTTHET
jgi:hypothetical protein